MKLFNDLAYIVLALLLVVMLIQIKNSSAVPQWLQHREPTPVTAKDSLANVDDLPLIPAADRTREINPRRFNFAKLVHRGQRVDSRLMERVLQSSSYSELVTHLAEMNKSMTAATLEAQLNGLVLHRPQSHYLNHYQLACNDDLCLGYFESDSQEQLQRFIDDFDSNLAVSGADSGFHYCIPADNSDNGLFGYRIAFNASGQPSPTAR
ncbi:hypothetical protein [Shewanella fodinae]|uniref:hypothetical protein n=1 Tax=Shewanella fodinae TaxID=552357 RepID=UPI00167A84B7|nr:hypothetical protein [Shewanella fodinae]MCL2907881.1 hypothetical protein [Shewanella fodinae]GGZ11389.1 hypothetical protein GCM10007169_29890 [Shewanella fodinae]